jgi:hypothetical protein
VERAFTKNFRVQAHGSRKALLASLLAGISNLPLPYLANKREHIVAVARATGDVTPYYPLWLYKSMHLAWMKQTYPDLNDSWLSRHEDLQTNRTGKRNWIIKQCIPLATLK